MGADMPEGDEGGGFSPNARIVNVSPDQIGRWRLEKSIALDNARWSLKVGRPDIAARNVAGAKFCHLQIMRIKAHLRRRAGRGVAELERLAQRIDHLTKEQAHEIEASLEARDPGAHAHRERPAGDRDRLETEAQRENCLDVSHADDGKTRPRKGLNGCGDPEGGSEPGHRELQCLNSRERELVLHLARGRNHAEIAFAMGLTTGTIRVYQCNAAAKMGIKGRQFREYAIRRRQEWHA